MTTTSTWIPAHDTETRLGAVTKDGHTRLDYLRHLEACTTERVKLAGGDAQPFRKQWIVFADGEYSEGRPWEPGDQLPDGAEMLEIKVTDSRELAVTDGQDDDTEGGDDGSVPSPHRD